MKHHLSVVLPIATLALVVGGLTAEQGGYFATSWGWASLGLVIAIEIWLVMGGRTDAGLPEAVLVIVLASFLGWVALSLLWSTNPAQTVLEIQRTLMLVVACATFVVLVRRESASVAITALVATITVVAGYGLSTRLFPAQIGDFNPLEYRLSAPIGYWNGLGIFAAMGIVLAVGLAAARAPGLISLGVTGTALVVLPVTLFFTFSRGALVALGLGFLFMLALSTRRTRLTATALVLCPVPAVGVFLASQFHSLTHRYSPLAAASDEGHLLAPILLVLVIAEATIAILAVALGRRIRPSAIWRRAFGAAVAMVVIGGLAVAITQSGNPIRLAQSAYSSFLDSGDEASDVDLTQRLTTLSGHGRADVWRVAWDAYRDHQPTGTGAGTFERSWQLNPEAGFKVRDAHSLYLETLSELGPVGLALLIAVLALPVIGMVRGRREPLIPPLGGAYAAFLVHAGIDWDWELAGVTTTAILIGVIALATGRDRTVRSIGFHARLAAMGTAIAIAFVAFYSLVGNTALTHAQEARDASRFGEAQTQALRAKRLMPWSAAPLIVLGEAQYEVGRVRAARRSFESAIRIDNRDWRAWIDLAVVSDGRQRAQALSRARSLYPTSPRIRDVAQLLEGSAG